MCTARAPRRARAASTRRPHPRATLLVRHLRANGSCRFTACAHAAPAFPPHQRLRLPCLLRRVALQAAAVRRRCRRWRCCCPFRPGGASPQTRSFDRPLARLVPPLRLSFSASAPAPRTGLLLLVRRAVLQRPVVRDHRRVGHPGARIRHPGSHRRLRAQRAKANLCTRGTGTCRVRRRFPLRGSPGPEMPPRPFSRPSASAVLVRRRSPLRRSRSWPSSSPWAWPPRSSERCCDRSVMWIMGD